MPSASKRGGLAAGLGRPQQKYASPFHRVPHEILKQILSHIDLCTAQGLATVRACLLACRQLYDAALPLSVHTFQTFDDGPRREAQYLKFLRYILITRPELAACVEVLLLKSARPGIFDKRLDMTDRYEDVRSVAKQIIDNFAKSWPVETGPGHRRQWCLDLAKGSGDAETALMLLACPRIHTLCIASRKLSPQLSRLVEIASSPSYGGRKTASSDLARPLSNLRTVYVEPVFRKYGRLACFTDVPPLFTLDGVRSYECLSMMATRAGTSMFGQIPPGVLAVEEIFIFQSIINWACLSAMVRACKSVRAFEYVRACRNPREHEELSAGHEELMPRQVLSALLRHHASLEYLHLNFDEDRAKSSWLWDTGAICLGWFLAHMKKLRILVAGMQALTGMLAGDFEASEHYDQDYPPYVPENCPRLVQCLPENLVHLEIHSCGEAILGQAQELLNVVACGKRFQRLDHIRLLFSKDKVNPKLVKLHCNSARVKLELVFMSRHNRIYDLGPPYYPARGKLTEKRDRSVPSICSRVHAGALRDQWLDLRGAGIGRASFTDGLYKAPGIDKQRRCRTLCQPGRQPTYREFWHREFPYSQDE